MSCSTQTNRNLRNKTMRPFNILYAIYLPFCMLLLFARPDRNSAGAWMIDLAAGVSMVAMLVAAAVGMVKQRDEFQRKLLTEAMMWGVGGLLAITCIWGLLEVHTSIPRMDILLNFPIFMTITAIAKVVLFRRNPAGIE